VGKGVLIRISKESFINVIKERPHYGIFLARLLAQRLVAHAQVAERIDVAGPDPQGLLEAWPGFVRLAEIPPDLAEVSLDLGVVGEFLGQLGTLDVFETWIVLYLAGERNLASRHVSLQTDCFAICPRRVHSRAQPPGAAAHDHNIRNPWRLHLNPSNSRGSEGQRV
jgi:hypothetical protein